MCLRLLVQRLGQTLVFSSLPGTRWMMVLARCTPTRFMSTTEDKSACEKRSDGQ